MCNEAALSKGFGSGWRTKEKQGPWVLTPVPAKQPPTDLCLSFPISPKAQVEGEPTISTALLPALGIGWEIGLILIEGPDTSFLKGERFLPGV